MGGVEFENVTVNTTVHVGAKSSFKNVTFNEMSDYYALLIAGNVKGSVIVDNCIFNTGKGRFIKVADEGVEETATQINLTVKNSIFASTENNKPAILVTSKGGATIKAYDNNISGVLTNSTNIAWVDEARNSSVDKVVVEDKKGAIIDNLKVENGDNVIHTGVATVNGAKYASLQKAIDTAQNGDIIKLVDNITINPNTVRSTREIGVPGFAYDDVFVVNYVDNKNIEIDLNGKTISYSNDVFINDKGDNNFYVFLINNGTNITITGDGEINGKIIDTNNYGYTTGIFRLFKNANAKLNVENGVFYGSNLLYVNQNGGEVKINGGRFENNLFDDGHQQTFNTNGYLSFGTSNNVIMYGGTLVHDDPRFVNDGNMVPDGYVVSKVKNADGKNEYTVIPENSAVASVLTATEDYDINHPGHTTEFSAKYGYAFPTKVENYYTSLKDAIANANAGETVTLTKNANGDGAIIDKDITIDLNGFKYTVDGKLVASNMNRASIGFQLLKGNGETANNITFKNGEIIASENAEAGSYFTSTACTSSNAGYKNGVLMLMQNYANLTLENVRLYGNKGNGANVKATQYVISNNNGNTTIKDSEINGIAGEYAFDVWGDANYKGTTVIVDNSIVRGLVNLGGTKEFKLVSGENEYTEAGDYVQKDSKFVAIGERSIEVSADKNEVKADEEVKVTVKLNGDNIGLAKYKLSYNKDYFTLIDAELEDTGVIDFSKNKGGSTEFATSEILATYTFKARAQRSEVIGSFELSNTEAYTFEEARLGLDFATPNNEKVDVKIVLGKFTAVVKVDNVAVEGNEKEISYDGKKHKVAINITPKDYKEIKCTYKFNGNVVMGEPDFKEIGTYEINYTVVTPDGYEGLTGEFKLTITAPSAYYAEVNTSTESGKSADYVAGKKLVLVYTDLDGVAFKYGNYDMINVSKVYNEYEYVGNETTKANFKYVYAYVADATAENTFESYKQHVSPFVVEDGYKIYKLDEYNEDINLNDKIEDLDATTENGVYGVHNDYFTFKTPTDSTLKQLNILKADVNGDKTVDPKDVQRVHLAVTNK